MEDLKTVIRDIPDFPQKGVVFKDITTLLSDAKSYHRMVDLIAHRYFGQKIEQVVGVEARGFVLGAALAYNCLLYTSPSPRDRTRSRMPSSA